MSSAYLVLATPQVVHFPALRHPSHFAGKCRMVSSGFCVIENPLPSCPFWATCFLPDDLRSDLGSGLLNPSLDGGLELFLLFLLRLYFNFEFSSARVAIVLVWIRICSRSSKITVFNSSILSSSFCTNSGDKLLSKLITSSCLF